MISNALTSPTQQNNTVTADESDVKIITSLRYLGNWKDATVRQ